MFQDLDQDLLANIFSFLPSGERGKAAHNLMNSSKHFYELFHQENSEVSQFSDLFREVFRPMYIPTVYYQLFLSKDVLMSDVIESMKSVNQCEILSESEFVVELNYSDPLLDDVDDLTFEVPINRSMLQEWKLNCVNSTLTELNMKSFENKRKININIFRFFPKFKLHFTYHRIREMLEDDDKYVALKTFDSIQINSYRDNYPIYKDLLQQAISKRFIEYTERYGVFELSQVYNEKEMVKLSKILSRGSSIELIDYFTIQKNLIHYFTNSFMANNTQLINYTDVYSGAFPSVLKNGLGLIENLSIIPWNVLSNNSRIKLATIFINHVFKDEINISDEFCSVYRQSQNDIIDSTGNELKYLTHDDHIYIKFLTLKFRKTKSIIRNNIISIPSYPNVTMEKLSHTIPSKDILIIGNKLDNFNTCCMKYCTFNTISAPLWLVPCWCWWGMIYSCICWTGPLCFKLPPNTSWTWLFTKCEISGLLDMESSYMSCLDPDVCLFVTLHGMCYLCCLPYKQIGPEEPRFGSWVVIENKWL